MLKISNVQQTYLNNKKVTIFSVYTLIDNTWVFNYNTSVHGWFKKEKTIATKHCLELGATIDLKDWEF